MNQFLNQTPRTLFFLLIVFSTTIQSASAEEDQNFNIPTRIFAITVPGLKTEPNRIDIPVKLGAGKSQPIAISNQWKIYGGTTLSTRPMSLKPIIVELHGTVGPLRKLIARVVVQYYPVNSSGSVGWKPMYQLNQEPLMIKTATGWKPLFDTRDSPEILGVLNRKHPNSAGYRPNIVFKLFKGKASIDSWDIRIQK